MKGIPYYPELILCDMCGRHTHGTVRKETPDSVECTSCRRELTKVFDRGVVKGGEKK